MISYWKNKNNNQVMQINQFETPTVYHETINNNDWLNITQEEYEALMPKEEPVVFRDNAETIESGWKAEEVQNEN